MEFLAKKPILKILPWLFFVAQSSLCKKIGSKWPLHWFFVGEGFKSISEASSCRVKKTYVDYENYALLPTIF